MQQFRMERITRNGLMRSPEEGTEPGAGPGRGNHANVQWRGGARTRRGRQPEMASAESSNSANTGSLETRVSHPQQRRTQRRRWTHEMNIDIMKSFYRATSGEDQPTIGYRQVMHRYWQELRPEIDVSEQRVADQRNAILRKQLLSREEILAIQREVRTELESGETVQEIIEDQRERRQMRDNDVTSNEEVVEEETVNNSQQIRTNDELKFIFETSLIIYDGLNYSTRPKIPKIKISAYTRKMVDGMCAVLASHERAAQIGDIEELRHVVYCAAISICKQLNMKIRTKERNRKDTNKPKWLEKLERQIKTIRSDLSILNNVKKGVYRNISGKVENVLRKYQPENSDNHRELNESVLIDIIDKLKQQLAVKSLRIQRRNKSYKRKIHNKNFQSNQKRFYSQLLKEKAIIEGIPEKQSIECAWKTIWGEQKVHKNAQWINEERNVVQCIEENNHHFSMQDLQDVLRKLKNWKAPGVDGIQNYWWKYLIPIQSKLLDIMNAMLQQPDRIPAQLMEGITYLIPKGNIVQDANKYRPITCLNTAYKIFTSLIAREIESHIDKYNIMSEEQKGCKKGSRGCKEQVIMDQVITSQIKKKHRSAGIAWVDYQKAYDSIPHSWLKEVLKIYKVKGIIRHALGECMRHWKTTLHLYAGQKTVKTDSINIQTGIYQGDSLSPIWFCLAINPLSRLLNRSGMGFTVKAPDGSQQIINHLLYMDDLKIYGKNKSQLTGLLNIVGAFSDDIGLKFGLDKCASLIANAGKITPSSELRLMIDNIKIKNLEPGEYYKYLGIKQQLVAKESIIKTEIQEEYVKRTKKILRSGLNSKNLIRAINTVCTPIITYSTGLVKWSKTDLEAIERKTRVLMTENRVHHPNACKERLYIKREDGGRGLISVVELRDRQIQSLQEYFRKKSQQIPLIKIICAADLNYTSLNLEESVIHNVPQQGYADNNDLKEIWKSKELHGRYPNMLENLNKTDSVKYLVNGTLYPETEGFITAIQDRVIATKNYRKYILREEIQDDRCRICKQASETIEHLMAACGTLANTEYLNRHNLSCKIIHQFLAYRDGHTARKEPYYSYNPDPVLENENSKIYWDRTVFTERRMEHNRPDITYFDLTSNKCYIIDVTHPADNNVMAAEATKINKYRQLAGEIKQLHGVSEVTIIPMVISATGLMSNNTTNYAWKLKIPRMLIYKIQRSAILETCRIIREVLNLAS